MDAESVHSGQLSHVPSDSALFLPQDERGDLLAAPKVSRLIYGRRRLHRETFVQVHLHILRHPMKGYPHHGAIQMQEEFPRGPVRGNL